MIVSISSQSENRYGIYVNGDRVWSGSRNIIAQGTARQIVERLKAEGFEVIPDFD